MNPKNWTLYFLDAFKRLNKRDRPLKNDLDLICTATMSAYTAKNKFWTSKKSLTYFKFFFSCYFYSPNHIYFFNGIWSPVAHNRGLVPALWQACFSLT